jgi:hypothetical protein
MPVRRSRKERLDHAANRLWKISLDLFEAMGYRTLGADFDEKGILVWDIVLSHRDPAHQVRPDVKTIVVFLEKNFRMVPFEAKIDSRSQRLKLKRSATRPTKHRPPSRSIIT